VAAAARARQVAQLAAPGDGDGCGVRTQGGARENCYRDANGRLAVGRVMSGVLGSVGGLIVAGVVSFVAGSTVQGGGFCATVPQTGT